VPVGHYPSLQEAKYKLVLLNDKGETTDVFTFKKYLNRLNKLLDRTGSRVSNHLHGGIIPTLSAIYLRTPQ
jgi:hypothetical protein